MRRSLFLAVTLLWGCGQPASVAWRTATRPPPTLSDPRIGIVDASCGPAVIPQAPPGRFPGPCTQTSPGPTMDWVVHYTYDGGALASWQSYEDSESWSNDAQGRLVRHERIGSSCGTVQTWTFDDGGRLASSSDEGCGSGIATTYHYDSAGHLASADSQSSDGPLNETFTVDQAGNVIKDVVRDENGAIIRIDEFTYDSSGRRTSLRTEDPSHAAVLTETWAYDAAGHMTANLISDGRGETHTFAGELEVETRTWNPYGGRGTQTTYCANGLPHTVAHFGVAPDGGIGAQLDAHQNWYDARGLLVAQTQPDGGVIGTNTYDAAGNLLVSDGPLAPHVGWGLTHTLFGYACW